MYSRSRADAESLRDLLTSCVSDVTKRCTSRRLQLNADKTEMIWFGFRSNLIKLQHIDQSLQVGLTTVSYTHLTLPTILRV